MNPTTVAAAPAGPGFPSDSRGHRLPVRPETFGLHAGPALPALVFLFLITATLFVVFAYHEYPVPSGDSHVFIPPAISLRAGHGLRNPLSALAGLGDPSGESKFLQYPPLFPLVIAALMYSSTPRAAFLAIAVLSVASLGLFMLLLWRILAASKARPLLSVIEGGLATLAVATALLGQQEAGRPEALASLIALVAWAAMARFCLLPSHWLIIGPLVGLMGAAHPMGAVLLFLLYCAVLSLQYSATTGFAIAAKSLVAALATFSAILAASPFGLMATLWSSLLHAQAKLLRGSNARLSWYWITSTTASFYVFPYLAALGFILVLLFSGRIVLRSRLLFYLVALGFTVIVWSTVVQVPEHSHNVLLFAPLVFTWNLYAAQQLGLASARIMISAFNALASLGFLRFIILFFFYLAGGVPLAEARSAFADLAGQLQGRIAITASFWLLAEDYDRMEVAPDVTNPGAAAAMIQQNYLGLISPPRIPGFVLLNDHFVRESCTLAGITIAHSMPGYGFAAYRRNPQGSRATERRSPPGALHQAQATRRPVSAPSRACSLPYSPTQPAEPPPKLGRGKDVGAQAPGREAPDHHRLPRNGRRGAP